MAHTVSWDAAYEAIPADTDLANTLGDVIRDLKRDVRERMEIDHDWDDVTNAGQHKKVTLQEQGADPAIAADIGCLYTKDVGTRTELFYRDSSGSVVQITSAGGISGVANFLLNNNVALQGKSTGGVARDLAKISNADKAVLGSPALQTNLQCSGLNALKADYGAGEQTIWHAGNDGTGGGLDADMVDGLHKTSLLTFDSAGALYFESGEITLVATKVSVAHGLGSVPRLLHVVIRCKAAGGEGGYALNDEVHVWDGQAASGVQPQQVWKSATEVGFSCSGGPGMQLVNKDTGATFTANTNWKAVFRAWK